MQGVKGYDRVSFRKAGEGHSMHCVKGLNIILLSNARHGRVGFLKVWCRCRCESVNHFDDQRNLSSVICSAASSLF